MFISLSDLVKFYTVMMPNRAVCNVGINECNFDQGAKVY